MSSNVEITNHREKKDALEVIRDFLVDKRGVVKMTEKQEDLYIKIRAAWTLLCNFKSREETIKIIMDDFGASEQSAKNWVLDAIWLYGDTNRTDKEGMRQIASEMAMKTFNEARIGQDYHAMNMATKNFIKINAIDKAEAQKIDWEKLQASIYVKVMDEHSEKMLKSVLKTPGTINLNNIPITEYEEVDNAVGIDKRGDPEA